VGKTLKDYGSHELALNFPYANIGPRGKVVGLRVGSLTIGLAYDGDWKATGKNKGRIHCRKSDSCLEYLTGVKDTLKHSLIFP
jgi:hypothetical protein